MIFIRKFSVCLILTICLLCSSVFVGCTPGDNPNDNSSRKFSFEGTLESRYVLGDNVSVPVAKIAGVTASHTVLLPDGTTSNDANISISVCGDYVINYSATVDGEIYKTSKTFDVLGPMFSIVGDGSISYHEPSDGVTGALVRLKEGARLRFNDVVDLNTFDRDMPFMNFCVMPETSGVAEANRLKVVLTDVLNDDNHLEITLKKCNNGSEWDYKVSYVSVAFNGGKSIGLERDDNGPYETYDIRDMKSHKYKAYVDNKYGTNMMFSMTGGMPGSKQTASSLFGFMYDVAAQQLFVTLSKNGDDTAYNILCADLTMRELYQDTFLGFTDGRVKVEIIPEDMQKNTFGLFVARVGTVKVEKDNYNSHNSSVLPDIQIDVSAIPSAKVGVPYQIFSATATDLFANQIKVNVKVFDEHGTEMKITDDAFTPDKAGNYVIEYSALNSLGKKAVNEINVKATE